MDPVPTPPPPPQPPKYGFKLLAILPVVAMVAALPFLLKSIRERQLTGSQAAPPDLLTEVRINPGGDVLTARSGSPTSLSALAFNSYGGPINSGVTYQWHISSNGSAGLLSTNGNLATFTPGSNLATGILTVFGSSTSGAATKSARLAVVDPLLDSFPGPSLNSTLWGWSGNGTVQILSNHLVLSNSAIVSTKPFIPGDVDAQVDVYPLSSGQNAYFSFSATQINRSHPSTSSTEVINVLLNNNVVNSVNLNPGQGTVKLRLARRGPLVMAYLNRGAGWELLYSWQSSLTTGNNLTLFVDQPSSAHFDNFYALVSPFANGPLPTIGPSGGPVPTPYIPGPPTLSGSPGVGSANLSWTYGGNTPSEYHIYRCTGAGCVPTLEEAPADATSPSTRPVSTSGITYGYRIRAHYHFRSLYSPYSNTVYVTPGNIVITPTPSVCVLKLTPNVLNLVSGGPSTTVTASVASGSGNATLTTVSFISGNSKVTVVPASDSTSPFVSSVKAVWQLFPTTYTTYVRAVAQLSDGRTCQTSTATDTDVKVN